MMHKQYHFSQQAYKLLIGRLHLRSKADAEESRENSMSDAFGIY